MFGFATRNTRDSSISCVQVAIDQEVFEFFCHRNILQIVLLNVNYFCDDYFVCYSLHQGSGQKLKLGEALCQVKECTFS